MNSRTNAVRPWTFVAALLIAAAAALAFAQPSADAEENPVVIRLGDEVVRQDTLEARFEVAIRTVAANRGVPFDEDVRAQLQAFLPQYLDQLATELVLVDEAQSRGLAASEDEVDATIERIRENTPEGQSFEELLVQAGFQGEEQLRTLVRESLLIDALLGSIRENVQVTEEQLRLAYQTNRDQFRQPEQACARHILLETAEAAEEVLAELEAGADFASLAQERSTGPSGPQGGDLGCLAPGQTVPAFDEALFSAPVGEPVGPVETQFGFHVILVSERQDAHVTPFAEARDALREQVVAERTERVVDALIATSGVQTYPDRLPAPAPQDGEPADGDADTGDDTAN